MFIIIAVEAATQVRLLTWRSYELEKKVSYAKLVAASALGGAAPRKTTRSNTDIGSAMRRWRRWGMSTP
jgi:hypothetical protein